MNVLCPRKRSVHSKFHLFILVTCIHTPRKALHFWIQGNTRLLGISQRTDKTGILVAGTSRQVIILLITFLEQSAFPIRIPLRQAFGILVDIRISILLCLLFTYSLIQLKINQSFMNQFPPFLTSHQRTICISEISDSIFCRHIDTKFTFFSFFSSDKHYSISTFRTIQWSRGCILQNSDTFNICRIQRFNNSHSSRFGHTGKVTQVIRWNRHSI